VGLFNKILVVCIGNICRSPTAETLLRHALIDSNIEIKSAGLGALVDHPIDELAHKVLEEHGHSPVFHSARQITPAIASESDLVLVMEKRHLEGVLKIAPQARGKVFLLGKWQGDREISDPYRQGRPAFAHAYALIEEAVQAWAQRLAR
jgi:protein-tyrosine phosphatase